MIIKDLTTINIDKLYSACCLRQEAKSNNIKNDFNTNLVNIYNHIELTYYLEDVSIYEYMLLKRYSTRCSILYNKRINYNSPDYSPELYNYAKLIYNITNDPDIINTPIKYNYPYMYGPSYLVRGDCYVTLSGTDLINIFDIVPSDFFIKYTKGKCILDKNDVLFNKKLNILDNIELYNDIKYGIKEKFIKSFYNIFFLKSTTGNDIISNSAIHYYLSNHESEIKLSCISNPLYKCEIREDNLDDIRKNILARKTENSKYFTIDNIISDTTVIFNIYSRFSTYIELLENLPKEFFISAEDLKIPSNFRELYIPIEIYNKYGDEMEDRYTELNNYIEKENRNFYVKYQCTYLNSMYSYSIKIKLDDVNKYINTINRNNILKDTKNIIEEIIRYSIAVLKLFK
jgi:hypothetical protein